MFDLANNQGIINHRERVQAQILGSFKDDPRSQVTLLKGISLAEFNSQYPPDQYERYSFDSLTKAKDDLAKAEDFKQDEFDGVVSTMTPVVVASLQGKKLMYVKKKA